MTKLILPLCLAALVIAPFVPVSAQEGSDVERLEAHIMKLTEKVEQLTLEVRALRAEIKALRGSAASAAPTAAGGTDSAPTEAPKWKVKDVAGSYTLDKEHMGAAMKKMAMKQVEAMSGGMTEEQKEMTRQQIEAAIQMQMEMMSMDVNVTEDGSFTVNGMMGMEPTSIKGTWRIDGSKIVFTQTHQNGEEKTDSPEMNARLVDGTLRLKPEGSPFELVLKKK